MQEDKIKYQQIYDLLYARAENIRQLRKFFPANPQIIQFIQYHANEIRELGILHRKIHEL